MEVSMSAIRVRAITTWNSVSPVLPQIIWPCSKWKWNRKKTCIRKGKDHLLRVSCPFFWLKRELATEALHVIPQLSEAQGALVWWCPPQLWDALLPVAQQVPTLFSYLHWLKPHLFFQLFGGDGGWAIKAPSILIGSRLSNAGFEMVLLTDFILCFYIVVILRWPALRLCAMKGRI